MGFSLRPLSKLVRQIYQFGVKPVLRLLFCTSLGHVQLFVTPWIVAHQAPLSEPPKKPEVIINYIFSLSHWSYVSNHLSSYPTNTWRQLFRWIIVSDYFVIYKFPCSSWLGGSSGSYARTWWLCLTPVCLPRLSLGFMNLIVICSPSFFE